MENTLQENIHLTFLSFARLVPVQNDYKSKKTGSSLSSHLIDCMGPNGIHPLAIATPAKMKLESNSKLDISFSPFTIWQEPVRHE